MVLRFLGRLVKLALFLILLAVAAAGGGAAVATSRLAFDTVTDLLEQAGPVETVRAAQAEEMAALEQAHLLELERARGPVSYRGGEVTVGEAVRDTAERAAARATAASARELASVPAEAMPYVGVSAILAAAAADLADACALMQDMDALAEAFGVRSSADTAAVCARSAPEAAAVWQSVTAAPQAVWAEAQAVHEGLPAWSAGDVWQGLSGFVGALVGGGATSAPRE